MKTRKILYLDVETSGLDAEVNCILQIASIYEVDGKVVDTFSSYVRPYDGAVLEDKALEVNGLRRRKIAKFPESHLVFNDFIEFLDSKVDKYTKEDKMIMVAYNGHFDLKFLQKWAEVNNYKYLHSYIDYRIIDPLILARFEWYKGNINPPNFQLGTVCHYYDIAVPNHDAMDDTVAMRELMLKFI